MKPTTKLILVAAGLILGFFIYSFKSAPGGSVSKSALVIFVMEKGNNQGFIINYGDGKIEKRPTDVKVTDVNNQIELQSKLAVIITELKDKGYHYAGSHPFFFSTMVFEKD